MPDTWVRGYNRTPAAREHHSGRRIFPVQSTLAHKELQLACKDYYNYDTRDQDSCLQIPRQKLSRFTEAAEVNSNSQLTAASVNSNLALRNPISYFLTIPRSTQWKFINNKKTIDLHATIIYLPMDQF